MAGHRAGGDSDHPEGLPKAILEHHPGGLGSVADPT